MIKNFFKIVLTIITLAIAVTSFGCEIEDVDLGIGEKTVKDSGRALICGETYLIVYDDGTFLVMNNVSDNEEIFSGIDSGDKIEILRREEIAESYPAQCYVTACEKTADGNISHIPRSAIDALNSLGWNVGVEDDRAQASKNQLLPDGTVNHIDISSLPKGYNYSFSGEDAQAIIDYLSALNLESDFEEDPNEYDGMSWVISLEYADGNALTVYHSSNMFIRSENGSWFRMTYEEASSLDTLLNELTKGSIETDTYETDFIGDETVTIDDPIDFSDPDLDDVALAMLINESSDLHFDLLQQFSEEELREYGAYAGFGCYTVIMGQGVNITYEDRCESFEYDFVYTITAYPDESDGGRYVTGLSTNSPYFTLCGSNMGGDYNTICNDFAARGFEVEKYGMAELGEGVMIATRGGISVSYSQSCEGISINVHMTVTNKEGIIY